MELNCHYYPANAFRICIDSAGKNVRGRIYTPLFKGEIPFVGMESLMKMDELFDKVGYPQAYQDKRSFDEDEEKNNLYSGRPDTELEPSEIVSKTGEKLTFDVVVNTRQNTSWQGIIYETGVKKISEFNSEVELVAVINEYNK